MSQGSDAGSGATIETTAERTPAGAEGPTAFESMAKAPEPGIAREFLDFARQNKKWWLLPILAVLGLFGALLALAGTGAAPFIYTLF